MDNGEHWPNGERVWVTRRENPVDYRATIVHPLRREAEQWTEVVPAEQLQGAVDRLMELWTAVAENDPDSRERINRAMAEAQQFLTEHGGG